MGGGTNINCLPDSSFSSAAAKISGESNNRVAGTNARTAGKARLSILISNISTASRGTDCLAIRTWRNELKSVMFVKIIAGGNQLGGGLVVDGFANEEIQALRSLILPVAKELSIKGRDNHRFDVGNAGQMCDLF